MVKLIRFADVSNVLENRGSLSPPFAIKLDRSFDERLKDSILLKERWKLIQSVISRKEIKIRNDWLFVHNKLYGKCFGSVFHPSSSDHVTISSQSKSSTVIIPDPLNNFSIESTAATDPANGLANLSHSGSDLLSFSLTVCLFNARSLVNKLSKFQSFVYSNPIDVYCITESWLSDSIFDNKILPSGYSIFRKDRGSRGGGILIAVADSIPIKLIPSPSNLEALTIMISYSKG